MILKVLWDNKKTYALGRNGDSKCIGIEMLGSSSFFENDTFEERFDIVEISPLNTRGGVTQCHIDVPVESIPEIVEQLEKIYQQEKFFVEKGEEHDDNRST
jgi:hypothetical protein